LQTRLDFLQKRYDLIEDYKKNISLEYPGDPFRRLDWTAWNPYELWYLADYMEEHESTGGPVTDKVRQMANVNESDRLREFASLLLESDDINDSITKNPSFEDGNEEASKWKFWNPEGSAHIQRVEGTAATGKTS